jgi:hypothetical protein
VLDLRRALAAGSLPRGRLLAALGLLAALVAAVQLVAPRGRLRPRLRPIRALWRSAGWSHDVAPIWTRPGAGALSDAPPATDPEAAASARGGGRGRAVRFTGRLLWAAHADGGTVFRLLAEIPDGSGRSLPVECRAEGFPFGRSEPLSVPDHPIAVEGVLETADEVDRRGPATRRLLAASRIDRRPQPTTAVSAEARLRQAFEHGYLYHAREPRLYLRDYRYDAASGTLHVADWTGAGAGLVFVLARCLAGRPEVETMVFDFYDCPPAREGRPAEPRLRLHARLRSTRLAGVRWERAYPSTLRLLADEWEEPRGLGGPDFRGLGGL